MLDLPSECDSVRVSKGGIMTKYAHEFSQEGGKWLGSLRTRVQTMFIRGNGEDIIWGSDEEIKPNPTIKQIEELGAYAVAGYHNEIVVPMLEELRVVRESLRDTYDHSLDEPERLELEKKINRLSMMIDNKPEWVLRVESGKTPT